MSTKVVKIATKQWVLDQGFQTESTAVKTVNGKGVDDDGSGNITIQLGDQTKIFDESRSRYISGDGGVYTVTDGVASREDSLVTRSELDDAIGSISSALSEILGDDGSLSAIVGHIENAE